MIAGDSAVLEELLADDLHWTHSSGVLESKGDFVAAIAAGAVAYAVLETEQDTIQPEGHMAIHHGVLRGEASRNGQRKLLQARFLAIWQLRNDRLQLRAWQSTNFSE